MTVESEQDAERRELELSYENALLLIGEIEEVIDELEEADPTDEQEERMEELLEGLVTGLEELPVSSEMARERVENVESWASLLASDGDEEAGPGGIPTLLRDELAELRGLLEYEMTT